MSYTKCLGLVLALLVDPTSAQIEVQVRELAGGTLVQYETLYAVLTVRNGGRTHATVLCPATLFVQNWDGSSWRNLYPRSGRGQPGELTAQGFITLAAGETTGLLYEVRAMPMIIDPGMYRIRASVTEMEEYEPPPESDPRTWRHRPLGVIDSNWVEVRVVEHAGNERVLGETKRSQGPRKVFNDLWSRYEWVVEATGDADALVHSRGGWHDQPFAASHGDFPPEVIANLPVSAGLEHKCYLLLAGDALATGAGAGKRGDTAGMRAHLLRAEDWLSRIAVSASGRSEGGLEAQVIAMRALCKLRLGDDANRRALLDDLMARYGDYMARRPRLNEALEGKQQ
jgi:hypothetical protein